MTKNISEEEKKNLENILQEKIFTELVGESPTSERIHFIYEVVDALRGAYNHEGIRRWFYRERVQLENNSPSQYLGSAWNPEDEKAKKVLELSRSLNKK